MITNAIGAGREGISVPGPAASESPGDVAPVVRALECPSHILGFGRPVPGGPWRPGGIRVACE